MKSLEQIKINLQDLRSFKTHLGTKCEKLEGLGPSMGLGSNSKQIECRIDNKE